MDIIGGKWKPCIINCISRGIQRPSELEKAIPYASKRSLTMQLKELEDHDILVKKIYPVLPPKVEYELTDFGNKILPLTLSMEAWGLEHKAEYFKKNGIEEF